MITLHQPLVDLGSVLSVQRQESKHPPSTVPPSLTLLLQFEDHLLGFLLLGAVSALDLLDLAVLSVQDLRTDGDILVHFKQVLKIIGFL